MVTKEQAKEKVTEYVNRVYPYPDDEYVVIDEETITKDYGWLFFLVNKRYLETQNISNMLVGLGAVLFEKQSQNIIVFGSALSGESHLEQYEKELGISS
jgi:hypothetical protein